MPGYDGPEWKISDRVFANVTGLDPEAGWLLGTDEAEGEARQFYLSNKLSRIYEARYFAETMKVARLTEDVPFTFVISPEPGGTNGADILQALDDLSFQLESAPYVFFRMSAEDRKILEKNGAAGAICNGAFFNKAVKDRSFQNLEKVIRLSSALREYAIPGPISSTWEPPNWVLPAFRAALTKSPKKSPKTVVVGVIDDSFAIGHPRFQFSDGTQSRIFSYWDQDADYNGNHSTVAFGRELLNFNPKKLNKAWPDMLSLNKLLEDAKQEKRPPAEFYDDPRLKEFFPPRPNEALRLASHGTHVLDLAAGAPKQAIKGFPSEQVANQAPALMLVKLPRSSVQDSSGAFLEFFLLQGVRHIIKRAKMLDKDAKVVIVSSYGFYGGPHDGASQIERALDKIVADGNGDVEIVLPSGNGRLERSHAKRDFNNQTIQEIKWRVPPDDDTPTVMEVWSDYYPSDENAMMELSIVTPDGIDSVAQGIVLKDDQTMQEIQLVKNGTAVVKAVCVHPILHPGRRQFLIWMQPTALQGPGTVETPAASGVWTVRLRALDPVYTRPASIWIRRDDSLVGFPSGGRQSEIERDDSVWKNDPNLDQNMREKVGDEGTAQRSGTISKIATGAYTVIVGGFDVGEGSQFPAPSSAGGPTEPNPNVGKPSRLGPDALAPSEIFGNIGLAAAGFFGGGEVRFRGTSVAAPLVASEIAQAIAKPGFPGGRNFVEKEAALSEANLPTRADPSAELGGAGRYITDRMRHRGMAFEHSGK